jgi:hypothetical protein
MQDPLRTFIPAQVEGQVVRIHAAPPVGEQDAERRLLDQFEKHFAARFFKMGGNVHGHSSGMENPARGQHGAALRIVLGPESKSVHDHS